MIRRVTALSLVALTALPVAAEPPIQPIDPSERAAALRELEDAAKSFEDTSSDYDGEMRSLVLREIRRRRRFLLKSYRKRIDDIDVVQRRARLEAIAALRKFIDRYPDHPKHTPDAMFRLAELYYEKAQVDNEVLAQQYERDIDLYERGKIPSEPVPPRENFAEAVKLYDEVIRRFPSFRFRDVAYYMKGYMLFRSGRDREAKDAWLALASQFPKSRFAAEAWLRVGEYHFDFGEWTLAEKAYLQAAEDTDSKWYGMALYKLAWTYFNKYQYDRAIRGFKQLISFYDRRKEDGEGQTLAAALRTEAIQYLARSLAEDDWDGDGAPDANAGVDRALSYLNDGEAYELEVLEEYAKALYELHEKSKYAEAARVYRRLIDRDPLNPRNPELHERLIETYDLADDMAASLAERDELVRRYAKGTPWYQANLANAGATIRADRLVEEALRQRAKFHHVRAQNLKVEARAEDDPAKLAASRDAYLAAADAYRSYLASYSHRRDAYEIRFLLAEALYYADEYMAAAEEYAAVRDTKGQTKYREPSAFSAIKSVEQEMEALVAAKKVAAKTLAIEADQPPQEEQSKRGTKIVRVTPEPLPEVVEPWIAHTDTYVKMGLEHSDEADFKVQQSYRVALMYYNYRHFDEARRRFELIMKTWPLKQEASFAARNLINSYKIENDWQNIELWIKRVAEGGFGRPEDVADLQKQLANFKLGQQFDRAVALYEEKRYVEAAEEFERIVNEDPKSPVADKALFNAAMAYQNAKRYNSAARVFERVATEPRFKGSQFREDALFYMAENSQKFFSFDKAAGLYLSLARSFPKSKRAHYAVYRAAQLEEMQGNLDAAASLYRRYARDFETRDDAAQALFAAGLVYEKMNDRDRQISLWKEFLGRFAQTPGSDAKVVEANLRLGDLYKASGNWKGAKRYYDATIKEFESRALEPGTEVATYPAKARFELVDHDFRDYETLKLRGSLANQGRIIQQKRTLLQELENRYVEVFPYKAFGWTIASYFRVGQLYQLFAQMLYEAPDPQGLSWEEMDEYRTMIEDEGLKWENVAIERYEVTVQQARKLKIVNDWSQLALKSLNRYKPQKYPLFKSEKREYDYGIGFMVPLSPPAAKPAVEPEPEVREGGATDEPKSPDAEAASEQPQPDEAATPEPEGAATPEPEEAATPEPEGAAPEPEEVPVPEVAPEAP